MPAMFSFRPQPIANGPRGAEPQCFGEEDAAVRVVAEPLPQYRPRHPECSAFYQLFETCFDSYVHGYDCHGLVTDGAFTPDGEFLPLFSLDAAAVCQLFRRLLLLRLHRAERLTESFMQNLLSWVHPGFSVYAGPPVDAAESASMESQARYSTRPVLAMDALEKHDDGRLVLKTPPDPRTGATSITLDPLEWIHRITSRIQDAIVKDSTGLIPIAGGFPQLTGRTKPPACRQRNFRNRTIRMFPGKPAARGPA